jgi:hypothetical protein
MNTAMHLSSSRHEHLLNVVTELQSFYGVSSSPSVPAEALVGVHRAVLHALTVFKVDADKRAYITTMQQHGHDEKLPVEELIRRRIAQIEAERSREGYRADWALRGLLAILRDTPLAPYKPDRWLVTKAVDYLRGAPTPEQLAAHEVSLLEPIAAHLPEIVVAYTRARLKAA